MSNVQKLAIPLLLLAAAGAAVGIYLSQPAEKPPTPPQKVEQPQVQEPKKPEPPPVVQQPVPDAPVRTNVGAGLGDSHADAAQGVRGRVVRPDGRPAADVTVMLVESSINDPIRIFLANSRGNVPPPLATAAVAADGTFALGVLTPDKAIDLRVVSMSYPELSRTQMKLREGDWLDTGDIQLEQGLVVQGHVVDSASKAPVANATVFMQSSNQSHAMIATPGRERGVVGITDQSGFFQFANAPRMGLINLVTEAPGYAAGQILNQQLKADALNDFTLQVERGEPIAGVVVDQDGHPISGAKIDVVGLSAKTPANGTTFSESNGAFTFTNLRVGPYQLSASATQFADAKMPLVLTGDGSLKVVMSQRASVKLRVLGSNKQPVKVYTVSLKRYHEGNELGIGNVADFPDRRINPGDYPSEFGGEWALIRGVPGGDFRFQITDKDHAKTLSPPFKVVDGGPEVEVVCELTLGASITGTVIDDRGAPVAGAIVNTDLNGGIAADTGIFELLRGMMPEKHTKASTRTDNQGRFRLNKLAFASYMLRVAHPDYCEGTAIDIKLETEGQVVDAGVIQLNRGTIVEGITSVAGVPNGQIKVVISTPMTNETLPGGAGRNQAPGQPPTAPARMLFSTNVLSEGNGQFYMRKRVPPGEYKITASRQDASNPFMALMDMKETEQKLIIAPGQDRVQVSFNLTKR